MTWILLRPSNYKQMAPLIPAGGSRHTRLATLPQCNIHLHHEVKNEKDGNLVSYQQPERTFPISTEMDSISIPEAVCVNALIGLLLFLREYVGGLVSQHNCVSTPSTGFSYFYGTLLHPA